MKALYKHPIMIAVAASPGRHEWIETYINPATRAAVTKEEIGGNILAARFARGSTVFATAVKGLEHLVDQS